MWPPPDEPQFNRTVWRIVRQIPPGRVSTYGQIASMIPPAAGMDPQDHFRLSPRWVGTAMRKVTDASVPWHRVINSKGMISLPPGGGFERQRARLESEGVVFDEKGVVDFAMYGWEGPDEAWLDEWELLPPRPLRP